jgi:hypothetical protein
MDKLAPSLLLGNKQLLPKISVVMAAYNEARAIFKGVLTTADPVASLHDGWSLFNAHTVWRLTTPVITAVAFL